MSFNRFAGRRAVLCFLGCLAVGLIAVAWRAKSRHNSLRAAAQAEALSQMAAVEAQLNQTVSAAQALNLLAKQNGGTVPNFSRAAADLLAVFPAVDLLELEPNGIISDVVPRAGHERMIGFNVMADPAQKAGTQLAIQQRALVVSGPMLLAGAELGIVARVPVFQRGRDNREAFWGFTAASMRLSQAIARARVVDLPRCGYNYLCYVAGTGDQHALTVSSYGTISLTDAVQQSIQIQKPNARIWLALQPRDGWYNWFKIGLEFFGVLLVSVLGALLINIFESRQAVEEAFAEANQQLARESAERQRNQDDLRAVKDAASTAQARQKELEEARASLQQAQETIADLHSKLQAAAQAEKDNAANVLTRLQQDQAAMADLHAHLDAATRSAREAAEASNSKIGELEALNQQLTARLAAAAHYEARVAELTASLQQAETEATRLRKNLMPASPAPEETEGAIVIESAAVESPQPEKPKAERRRKSKPAEEPAVEPAPESAPVDPIVASETAPPYHAESVPAVTAEIQHNGGEHAATPEPDGTAPVTVEVALTDLTESAPATQEHAETAAADSDPAPEKPAKSPRKKKARRVDQMDLFGGSDATEEKPREPVVDASVAEDSHPETASLFNLDSATAKPAHEPRRKAHREPAAEPASPLAASTSETVVLEKTPAASTAVAEEEPASAPAADSKTQARTLRRFVEEYSRTPEKIRDDLVQGDLVAAQKAIQTLKDAADEAGAKEVHTAASALDRAIHDQADPAAAEFLWADLQKAVHELAGEVKPVPKPKAEKVKPSKPLPPPPPLDVAELRAAVGMIVPLLMDQDPGARDCLKDNRDTFRSTFSPEGYVDFEEAVKGDDYATALEHLRKVTRKHGISV